MVEEKKVSAPQPSGVVTDEEKVMGAIAYLGILFLIPMLAKKDSAFAQFHAKQGLVMFVIDMAVILLGMIPFVGWFFILPFGSFVVGIVVLISIIQAATGKMWRIPLVADLAEKIKLG